MYVRRTYVCYDERVDMDRKLRRAIRRYLRGEHTSQAELAGRLGMSPQYLNDVLTGRRAKLPKSLTHVLEELNLELRVIPRGADTPSAGLPSDIDALLAASGPLEIEQERGRPQGSNVRLSGRGSVADAVVEERNEHAS